MPRPDARRLYGAMLLALVSPVVQAQQVALAWHPPEKHADRVVVEFQDLQGATVLERVVALGSDPSIVFLSSGPLNASSIVVSTPLHSGCRMPLAQPLACTLTALQVVHPFGSSHGRLWIRSRTGQPFQPVKALEPGWGETGFPLPPGRFDVIRAPDGRPAQLLIQANSRDLDPSGPVEQGPSELRGRLQNPDGKAFEGPYSLTVEPLPEAAAGSERRAAWVAFYAREGVELGKGGSFRVTPLAADPLTFRVKIPGKPPIRFATFRRGVGQILDVGSLRVLSGSTLTISVALESQLVLPEAVLNVEARLNRPDPGTAGSDTDRILEPLQALDGKGRALTLPSLSYGTWSLRLLATDTLLGTERVTVASPETTFHWRVTDETIEGRVTDLNDVPIAGAKIEVDRPARARGMTDDDGHFLVTFPHAGGEIIIHAGVPGAVLGQHRVIDPRSSDARDLVFRFPAFKVTATISSADDNKPVVDSGLALNVMPSGPEGRAYLSVKADDVGIVRAAGLPAGRVEVRAGAPGFAEWGPKEVILSAEHPEETLEIRLKKVGRLLGFVHDQLGNPLPGAHIRGPLRGSPTANTLETIAGPDGRFQVDLPPDQLSILGIWALGFRLGFFTVSPQTDPADIELWSVGTNTEVEIRTSDGDEIDRGEWGLVADDAPVDESILQSAFGSNACPHSILTRSRVRIGGCLMPGHYALLLTTWNGQKPSSYLTDSFDPTVGAPLRVVARPR